jgi:hypothetical protein
LNEDKRIDLLKDEYIMLQNFYEDIDSKGLTIKNWAITVALPVIGTGLFYRKEVFLIGLFASIVFWYLEAYWRGLSHFFATRIKHIELAFQNGMRKCHCRSIRPGQPNIRDPKIKPSGICSNCLRYYRTW